MTEQKFQKGDLVRVRRFDEIDRKDLGHNGVTSDACFGIDKDYINRRTDRKYKIAKHTVDYDANIYKLYNEEGMMVPYTWLQGMLDFAFPEEELPEPDEEGLFSLLSV